MTLFDFVLKKVFYEQGYPAKSSTEYTYVGYIVVFQFIVSEDGRVGLTYEHSPAEGQPIASVVDHIFTYM